MHYRIVVEGFEGDAYLGRPLYSIQQPLNPKPLKAECRGLNNHWYCHIGLLVIIRSPHYGFLFKGIKEAMYICHFIKENLTMPKGSGGYDADGASFNIKFIYKHSDKKTLEGSFKLDGTKKISFIKETILD